MRCPKPSPLPLPTFSVDFYGAPVPSNGATKLPIDVHGRKGDVRGMHTETFIRKSRLIEQARSLSRSRLP